MEKWQYLQLVKLMAKHSISNILLCGCIFELFVSCTNDFFFDRGRRVNIVRAIAVESCSEIPKIKDYLIPLCTEMFDPFDSVRWIMVNIGAIDSVLLRFSELHLNLYDSHLYSVSVLMV